MRSASIQISRIFCFTGMEAITISGGRKSIGGGSPAGPRGQHTMQRQGEQLRVGTIMHCSE